MTLSPSLGAQSRANFIRNLRVSPQRQAPSVPSPAASSQATQATEMSAHVPIGSIEAPCLYVTPGNSNGPIPNQSELPERPRSIINSQIARVIANLFDDDDSVPDNFYQVLTPNGQGCRARVEYKCNGETVRSMTLSAEGDVLDWTWGDGCNYYDDALAYRCTEGSYREFSGTLHNSQVVSSDGIHRLYAWDNPDVGQSGTIAIELVTEEGQPTSGELEVRRAGSPHVWRVVSALGGEEHFACEAGDYDVTGYQFARAGGRVDGALVRSGWRGTRRVECREGRTYRYTVRLDTAPVLTARVEPEVYSVARPEGIDFPQADGQLCDANDQPLSFDGTLSIRGIDFYHDSSIAVDDGRYTLFGLRRGRYLLRFDGGTFYAEQVIQIPFKLITDVTHRDFNLPMVNPQQLNRPSGSQNFRGPFNR